MEKSNVEKCAEKICEENKMLRSEIDEKKCQIAEMKKRIDILETEKGELRVRCHESVRDNFDNHLYGLLHIVGREELKTQSDDAPTPIRVAEMLIYAKTTREISAMKHVTGKPGTVEHYIYSKSELRQIVEHLLVYCNHAEE